MYQLLRGKSKLVILVAALAEHEVCVPRLTSQLLRGKSKLVMVVCTPICVLFPASAVETALADKPTRNTIGILPNISFTGVYIVADVAFAQLSVYLRVWPGHMCHGDVAIVAVIREDLI